MIWHNSCTSLVLRYETKQQDFMLNHLKFNTLSCNLWFVLTIAIIINVQHFTKDNLFWLICARLHEMIFDMLDYPLKYTESVLSAHLN